MSEATIKAQLLVVLKTTSGIASDHVFIDEPDTAPTNEQMPCIVVTLPRITPSIPYNDQVRCTYHFVIHYLYAPYELATPTKNASGASAYLSNVWTALLAEFTLNSTVQAQDFDGDVMRPLIQFRDTWYWGISIPWRAVDETATTITP